MSRDTALSENLLRPCAGKDIQHGAAVAHILYRCRHRHYISKGHTAEGNQQRRAGAELSAHPLRARGTPAGLRTRKVWPCDRVRGYGTLRPTAPHEGVRLQFFEVPL